MLQRRQGERTRGDRARRLAVLVAGLILSLGAAEGAHALPFRAFSMDSPWNQTAAPYQGDNPIAGQFTDRPDLPMRLSGTPDQITFASPVYFAQPGDPAVPITVTQNDWQPDGDTAWNGQTIPAPLGVAPAPGPDGHLTVVSEDRLTAWEFFGCTQAGPLGYVTRVVAQWNLTGPGYSAIDGNNSARGSGLPLISTSLRAEEALEGIQHALGFTVPRVSTDYVAPATHSDGRQGPDMIKYGMRFVLRPDYPIYTDASVGAKNVMLALKVYGAYITDQGADFELDADPTRPDLWQQAGLAERSFGFKAEDLRPARLGPPAEIPPFVDPPVKPAQQRARVELRAGPRLLKVGRRLRLRGRVAGRLRANLKVRFELGTRGRWRRLHAKPVAPDGRFELRPRLYRPADSRQDRLRLEDVLLRPGTRTLKLRAVVPRAGRSRVVRVLVESRAAASRPSQRKLVGHWSRRP